MLHVGGLSGADALQRALGARARARVDRQQVREKVEQRVVGAGHAVPQRRALRAQQLVPVGFFLCGACVCV